jgi:glycosyltransferase involved in cell wall biosynthesis
MQNKIKIIIPSYNNTDWVEYNIASVLNQTYTNYEVLYIDDASQDDTFDKVNEVVGSLSNWQLKRNETNQGATANYFEHLDKFVEDSDIVIHLDGDDWLYDENVLEQLNTFYNEKDCWMTYGGFVCWDGTEDPKIPYPQSTPYTEFIHKHKLYRRDEWRASHMRTYRGSLLKALPKDALKSLEDKQYYWHASDLAFQFAYMEMCPKDKIQVVDFYTTVYNQSNQNSERTREREHTDNSRYEVEVRNRKHYKEGLQGEKLPQVNLWNKDYYHEYCNIPTKFSFCYDQVDGEFDMTVLCDPAILQYLAGEFKVDRNVPLVVRLFEQREYFNRRIYNAILENYDKFDAVLTFDRELLKLIPNAIFLPPTEVTQFNRLPNPYGHPPYKSDLIDTYEIPEGTYQVYPKSKLVSAIVSSKAFLPGHVKRLEFIKAIRSKIDLFGRGMGKEIPSKIDALRDYMFSVSIENVSCDDNYFSEKIIDCFITGTVPIYHGCTNIGEFFDMRGILYFENQEQLDEIIDSLTPEKYESMLEYVKINYEKAMQWPLDNDMVYEKYYKDIIERGVNRKPLINTKWY